MFEVSVLIIWIQFSRPCGGVCARKPPLGSVFQADIVTPVGGKWFVCRLVPRDTFSGPKFVTSTKTIFEVRNVLSAWLGDRVVA